MKRTYLLFGILLTIVLPVFRVICSPVLNDNYDKNSSLSCTQKVQIPFIANKGQLDNSVQFYAHTLGGTTLITKNGEIVYSLANSDSSNDKTTRITIKERIIGGQIDHIIGKVRTDTKVSVFKGSDPLKWIRNLPSYNIVYFGDVYDGIRLKLKAYGNNVEKLFYVSPGANPSSILLGFDGVEYLQINESEQLELHLEHSTISFTKPVAYQIISGRRDFIEVAYKLSEPGYGFALGDYDHSKTLIIVPMLASTFLGGSDKDGIHNVPMVMDAEGNIYVASRTQSMTSFPTTSGVYSEDSFGGDNDIFISKFSNDLTTLLASTYLGGFGDDGVWPGLALALDQSGNIVVAGRTNSVNFPRTAGVLYENRVGGYDAFISKLSPNLDELLSSTYFGGSLNEYYIKMTLDGSDNIFISGTTASSFDFPITDGALDPDYGGGGGGPYPGDLFVSKISNDMTTLLASTYLGGVSYEYCEEIVIDEFGNVFLTGWTGSSNFPYSLDAYDRYFAGGYYDAFVTCLDADLTTLVASTFLGGSEWDFGFGLTIAEDGDIYVTGHTASSHTSTVRFPTTTGAFQETYRGIGADSDDAFVARFNNDLTSLLACTYFGGANFENGTAIKIGDDGRIYLGGVTSSSNLEICDNTFDPDYGGGSVYAGDAFVSILSSDLSEQFAFSYIGGSGSECLGSLLHDNLGNIYVSGSTNSGDFPSTDDTHQSGFGGGGEGIWASGDDWGGDIYVSKLTFNQFTRVTEGPHVTDIGQSTGICWIDYDEDGYLDIYVTNFGLDDQGQNNDLYRNLGDGTFEKIIGLAIVDDQSTTESATWGDFDNDGDLDVFLASWYHTNNIYLNDGTDNFAVDTDNQVDDGTNCSSGANWVDYDNDGDLDLFITNPTKNPQSGYEINTNSLYRNNTGNLTKILTGEIATDQQHSYCAAWCDFDNDGDLDVAIAANNEYIDFYRNDGNDLFVRLSESVICQTYTQSLSANWADYDNDGDMDLFVAGYTSESHLFQNDSDGTFTVINGHGLGGVRCVSGEWADYDNDGDLDMFAHISTDGVATDAHLYENDGNGNFIRVDDGVIANDDMTPRAASWGDYNRDGFPDLYMAEFDPTWSEDVTNSLYLNNGNSNNWIIIKPIGTISNRSAIGIKIRLKATVFENQLRQMRELTSITGEHSQGPLELHFGLGDATLIDSIRIEWPSGSIQILADVAVNQFLTITEILCGDVDGSEIVDILDIVFFIDWKFKDGPIPESSDVLDVNADGAIDILDIIHMIDWKFKDGPLPTCLN
jgi:hypothetical protein